MYYHAFTFKNYLIIHINRSLFLYLNNLVSVTAGWPKSPRGHM